MQHTWNTKRLYRRITSQISGGWTGYLKPKDVWQTIDASILPDLSCTAFPGNVQFAANSQDWSTICIDGTFSMKRHIESTGSDDRLITIKTET
jgi:hypothetical protein